MRKIRDIKWGSDDTLVIFGEVFRGGYVTGLVEAAQKRGMRIIYSTVGRRDTDGKLRRLNAEEVLQKPLINIPLEAGFDREPALGSEKSPVDLCQSIRLSEWDKVQLDESSLEESRERAVVSFKARVTEWVKELESLLPSKGRVLIAHTMAGGVPRAKILLPMLNRVFKGYGKRFLSSELFWQSTLGRLCEKNFNEVTAQTYQHLIELTTSLRNKLQQSQREVFYIAYSYHGAEVVKDGSPYWQSYSPYLQGFAKLELEKISSVFSKGVRSCVFNVPEILTKSSAIFPGVEIPLYTILGALKTEGGEKGKEIADLCLQKLKDSALNIIEEVTKEYFESAVIKQKTIFEKWPQHNSEQQMEKMLHTSKELASLHKDSTQSITPILSEVLFKSCGHLILQETSNIQEPVCYLGHDVITQDVKARY